MLHRSPTPEGILSERVKLIEAGRYPALDLARYDCLTGAPSYGRPFGGCLGCQIVSIDHFQQALSAQLGRATAQDFADVLITCGDLYRSVGGYPGSDHGMPVCCDAMEAEILPGDIVLVEKDTGAGMTVRYYLPRSRND
jgi:hypothetical protein